MYCQNIILEFLNILISNIYQQIFVFGDKMKTFAIVLICIGIFVIISIIVACIYWCKRKVKSAQLAIMMKTTDSPTGSVYIVFPLNTINNLLEF